jgi:hypothetical protein
MFAKSDPTSDLNDAPHFSHLMQRRKLPEQDSNLRKSQDRMVATLLLQEAASLTVPVSNSVRRLYFGGFGDRWIAA